MPSTPLSPVRAKVTNKFVELSMLSIDFVTIEQLTSKYPVFSVNELITNNRKSLAIPLFTTLKCPFIGLVASSIVVKNVEMSVLS